MKKVVSIVIMAFLIVILGILSYKIIGESEESYTGLSDFGSYSDLEDITGKGYLIDDDSNLSNSGVTGESYQISTSYCPYYTFLSSSEKSVYKQVYANILEFKDAFVPVETIYKDSVLNIVEAVLNDHPELFWIDNSFSYKYTSDNICRQIILNFNDLANNYEANKRVFESSANSIISYASTLSTNFEKEVYVHNALIDRITYDLNSPYNQTAYSALVNGRTVCAGYSKAFQYIMTKLGVPAYYVTGSSKGENHAWNIIRLEDGFYNVDVTWDDASSNHYLFFNLTDKEFSSSHTRGVLSSYLPACSATKYRYTSKASNNEAQDNLQSNVDNKNKVSNDDQKSKEESSDVVDDVVTDNESVEESRPVKSTSTENNNKDTVSTDSIDAENKSEVDDAEILENDEEY